jgi:hypothetical protein
MNIRQREKIFGTHRIAITSRTIYRWKTFVRSKCRNNIDGKIFENDWMKNSMKQVKFSLESKHKISLGKIFLRKHSNTNEWFYSRMWCTFEKMYSISCDISRDSESFNENFQRKTSTIESKFLRWFYVGDRLDFLDWIQQASQCIEFNHRESTLIWRRSDEYSSQWTPTSSSKRTINRNSMYISHFHWFIHLSSIQF